MSRGLDQIGPFLSRLRQHRVVGIGVVISAVFILVAFYFWSKSATPPPPERHDMVINVVPPPPPPPPPPRKPPPPPPQQKMIAQPKLTKQDIKEEKPIDKPREAPPKESKADEPPPGPLALNAKAEGPGDLFNLGGKPGGNGLLDGGGGGGSRWGWYAAIVQQQCQEALGENPRTRSAVLQVEVRLWADSEGRITRVVLVSSTGDANLDHAISSEAIGGLVLRQPPPKDMPMPMVLRFTERRSSRIETKSSICAA
jgi:periplasmic protein TonB